MIRSRLLRSAARVLLGAFVAAYALTSMHVYARAAQPAHAAMTEAAGMEEHCQERKVDPAVLLCKHHCQSELQTLDHPVPVVDAPVAALLAVLELDPAMARKPLRDKALRPIFHPGGAPPPYLGTARLRI